MPGRHATRVVYGGGAGRRSPEAQSRLRCRGATARGRARARARTRPRSRRRPRPRRRRAARRARRTRRRRRRCRSRQRVSSGHVLGANRRHHRRAGELLGPRPRRLDGGGAAARPAGGLADAVAGREGAALAGAARQRVARDPGGARRRDAAVPARDVDLAGERLRGRLPGVRRRHARSCSSPGSATST